MIRKKQKQEGPIVIDLIGPDGNAFMLLGLAKQWCGQFGLNWPEIRDDMKSGDYEHLLSVLDKHFGDYVIFER